MVTNDTMFGQLLFFTCFFSQTKIPELFRRAYGYEYGCTIAFVQPYPQGMYVVLSCWNQERPGFHKHRFRPVEFGSRSYLIA